MTESEHPRDDGLADGPADAMPGPVPEAGRAVDLQPDVERLHRAILREPRDPVEGAEPAPWFFKAAIVLAIFWGGWYLGRYGGEFGLQTHIALGARDAGTAAAVTAQSAAAEMDPVAAGQRVFANNCASCHQTTGKGMPGAFPPVVGSEWVTGAPETLARIILFGLQGPVEVAGATYNGAMPAWHNALKDEEIAAVATYLRQWAPNAAGPVTTEQVAALRAAHADRTTPWTVAELRTAGAAPAPAAPPGGVTPSPAPAAPGGTP